MDPAFIAYCALLGVETVAKIIGIWKKSGEPTEAEILALRDKLKDPEEYFPT